MAEQTVTLKLTLDQALYIRESVDQRVKRDSDRNVVREEPDGTGERPATRQRRMEAVSLGTQLLGRL